jgi:hypothetical protein
MKGLFRLSYVINLFLLGNMLFGQIIIVTSLSAAK